MLKGFIGYDEKAKYLNKGYVGVNNKARKIKKGYIGVNGVARKIYPFSLAIPIIEDDDLYYNGHPQTPVIEHYDPSRMTASGDVMETARGEYTINFSLIDSGDEWDDGTSAPKSATWKMWQYMPGEVQVFLAKYDIRNPGTKMIASIPGRAFVGGGFYLDHWDASQTVFYGEVDTYDEDLTYTRAADISRPRGAEYGNPGTVGAENFNNDYVVFGPGVGYNDTSQYRIVPDVDCYDVNLTKHNIPQIPFASTTGAGCSRTGTFVNQWEKLIYASRESGIYGESTVHDRWASYDKYFTQSLFAVDGENYLDCTTAERAGENYIVFIGQYYNDSQYVAHYLDENLTHTVGTSILQERFVPVSNYLIGIHSSESSTSTIDIFDEDLVRSTDLIEGYGVSCKGRSVFNNLYGVIPAYSNSKSSRGILQFDESLTHEFTKVEQIDSGVSMCDVGNKLITNYGLTFSSDPDKLCSIEYEYSYQ